MKSLFIQKETSSIGLIIIGIIGLILGPLALFIGSFGLIILGIYNIIKKNFDIGFIILIIGIGISIISKFLNAIIKLVSISCIILGIVLFIFYLIKLKE